MKDEKPYCPECKPNFHYKHLPEECPVKKTFEDSEATRIKRDEEGRKHDCKKLQCDVVMKESGGD